MAKQVDKETGEILPALDEAHMSESRKRLETMVENLGGRRLDPVLFPRVAFPTGGGTGWAVPGPGGDTYTDELQMVILGVTPARAYWSEGVGEGDVFPQCISSDGRVGHGDPGGECAVCPMAEFGSAGEGSRRQACREFRALLGFQLPALSLVRLRIPPSSLRRWDEYAVVLGGEGLKLYNVVTGITLERSQSRDNITFSKASFRMIEALAPETVRGAEQARGTLFGVLESISGDDYAAEEANDGRAKDKGDEEPF